jgi:hypothetical protein
MSDHTLYAETEHGLPIEVTYRHFADFVADAGTTHQPAELFRDWLGSGVERIAPSAAQAIVDRFDVIPDEQTRRMAKFELIEAFGKPTELSTDRLNDVMAWLDQRLAVFTQPEPTPEPEPETAVETPPAEPPSDPDVPPPSDPEDAAPTLLGAS